MLKVLPTLLISLFSVGEIYCQLNPNHVNDFFKEDTVPRIDIIIDPDSLNILVEDLNTDHEYRATFIYNNYIGTCDTFENVGFRIRGNVSRIVEKKSFKISLNTYVPGRKYHGLEKINLKSTGDDSFIRPKLSWYLCQQMGIPSIWVNHVQLYINNNLWGLYSNVEHIDEEFIAKRFGNNSGNLFKCRYPSDLNWMGNNEEEYKYTHTYFGERELRVYELKTNTNRDNYSDLMELINVLNNSADADFKEQISKKINIPNLLKFFALEVYLGHWDSYSQGGNNYFLYHNQATDKFEYITYDMDLTFGIEFGMEDIIDRYIYNYERDSQRNILRSRIIGVPEFRNMYTHYLKQLTTLHPPDSVRKKAELIQNFIAPFVEQDPYYPFGIDEFYASLDSQLGMAKQGIIEYLNLRYNSILEQLDDVNISPIISNVQFTDCTIDDSILIRCTIEDDDTIPSAQIHFLFGANDTNTMSMNLVSQGSLPGEYTYEIVLKPTGKPGLFNFFIEAIDRNNQISLSPYANNYSIYTYSGYSNLKINEILAANNKCMTDEFGEHEDWIEIVNRDSITINLSNKYLSDSYGDPDEWQLPDINLEPGEIVWFWADNEPTQGDHHAAFRLSRGGETVYLFEQQGDNFIFIDSLNFSEQNSDESFGILPDDLSATGVLPRITPGVKNDSTGLAYLTFNVDMNYIIDKDRFNPRRDVVDVVGNFNSWNDSSIFMDNNNDSVYTQTIYNVAEGENIEYRFRINQNPEMIEFIELPGSEGDRFLTLSEGCNSVKHYFNDELATDIKILKIPELVLYPNPVGDYLYIQSDKALERLEIIDIFGRTFKQYNLHGISEHRLDMQEFANGVFFIRVSSENGLSYTQKILKL